MPNNTPQAPTTATIADLFTLHLVDGLPVQSDGKTIRYQVVKLRETNVADERTAQRLAERVVFVAGAPKLLVSESEFRFAMTAQHIEAFVCDGQRIPQAVIDLDLIGKLSSHDLGLIEQRVFLINLAAEVRYGNLDQSEFDAVLAGKAAAPASPQRGGQTVDVGQAAAEPQSGPALLTDFTGDSADRTVTGDGV